MQMVEKKYIICCADTFESTAEAEKLAKSLRGKGIFYATEAEFNFTPEEYECKKVSDFISWYVYRHCGNLISIGKVERIERKAWRIQLNSCHPNPSEDKDGLVMKTVRLENIGQLTLRISGDSRTRIRRNIEARPEWIVLEKSWFSKRKAVSEK